MAYSIVGDSVVGAAPSSCLSVGPDLRNAAMFCPDLAELTELEREPIEAQKKDLATVVTKNLIAEASRQNSELLMKPSLGTWDD